jgi:hypothetical protein
VLGLPTGAHGKRVLAAVGKRPARPLARAFAEGPCDGRQYALWKVIEHFAISVLPEPSRMRSLSGSKNGAKASGAKPKSLIFNDGPAAQPDRAAVS